MPTNTPNPIETRYSGVILSISASQAENLDDRGIPKSLGRLYRKVQPAAYDKEKRTVTMAASSGTPVERYFGQEILSHEKGAIRTGRLDGGISLLFNHDYDQLLGRSQGYELGDPLHVTARFGTSALAIEKERDVEAEVLVDVSIGYIVYEWEITEDKNGVRTYLAVDWELLEVSLVTVPADPTVGVGRTAKDAMPVKVRSFRKFSDDESDEDDDEEDEDGDDVDDDENRTQAEQAETSTDSARTTTPAAQRITTMADETKDLAAENKTRIAGLQELRKAHPTHFTEDQLMRAITTDLSVRDAKDAIFDSFAKGSKRSEVPTLADETFEGMSEKERRSYSLRNAYASLINQRTPGTFTDKEAEAGFEREVSDTLRKKATERGLSGFGGGIIIPSATTRSLARSQHERALSSGGNAGATTNFTVVNPDPIELLRSKTVCLALGATMMTGLHGTPKLTRQNGAGQSNWLAEGGSATNTDPTLDAITMTPHRLSMFNSYYLELLAQSALAVDSFLAADRMNVLARSLDFAGLAGPGTGNSPLGMMLQTGISAVLTGTTRATSGAVTAGAGGVPMTFVDVNNMEAAISTQNGDIGTMGWAMRPKVRAAMRSTPQIPGTASGFIFPNSTPDANGIQEGPLGYRAIASTAVPTGYTVNSVANLDAVILGVWDQMIFGDWGLSELIADPYTGAAQGLYKIIEHALYDTNVRHVEAFAVSTSVLPS